MKAADHGAQKAIRVREIEQAQISSADCGTSPMCSTSQGEFCSENGHGRMDCVHELLTDLKSCSMRKDINWGRRLHANADESGGGSNVYVVTALIRMYAKCGSMAEAHQVFDKLKKPKVASWTALLLGYAENGKGQECLELFSKMRASGCSPDSVTYVAALKACTALAVNCGKSRGLKTGRNIHLQIGDHLNHYVQNTLIDMYAKCGSMTCARQVFDNIKSPNVVSWNVLLLGYAENGEGYVCLELLSKMKDQCKPDSVTFVAALKACTSLAKDGIDAKAQCLRMGCEIHLEIGKHLNIYVQNTLIDMYAKCGSMVDARRVFDGMLKGDVKSWTALLLGYAENGEGLVCLEMFCKMKADGVPPDSVTYVAVLKACTSLADSNRKAQGLKMGCEVHSQVGELLNIYVQNTLIDMYSKCGSMVDARQAFDSIEKPDLVSWNALLWGYAENGEGYVSLELFSKMKAHGCIPDSVSYVSAIKACTSLGINGKAQALEMAREIHAQVGDQLNCYVQSTLIDMYVKCGSMVAARQVFDSDQNPSVMSWNALLLGYADTGEGLICLDMLLKMKADQCPPNASTQVAALKACGLVGALDLGRRFHSEISEFTAHLVTCLVDFYARCGSMEEARRVFDTHTKVRDVTTWTVLLSGYSSCGDFGSVLNLFEAMQESGLQPDGVSFVCMLVTCAHAGLVTKAWHYLNAMPRQYNVTPGVLHYSCMADALGRANQLNEAVSLVRKMPCNPNAATWSALLAACRKRKYIGMARLAFQSLVEINKEDASAYVVMAHVYGSRGMWEEQARVLERRTHLGI